MADIRNIKILGTVEASTNSSIILTGSNTLIKKVLDDGKVLFEVNDSQVVVSGNIMLSGSGEFNNVSRTNNGMYSIDTALHAIDQAIEDKGAEIRSAYEAVRFRHFGTLGPYGLTRLNLTQLATSGSQYFASGNLKDITIDLLIDSNGDGVYRNDMASIILFVSGSNLYADIDAPSAAGNAFRFIAVNETLLDVINTSASYNTPSSGGGVTAQEISSSFVQISNINDSLAGYATLSGVSASFATPAQVTSSLTSSKIANFTNDVRSKFTAGTNITITNGVIDAASTGITSTQVTSALTPYATLSGVSGTFLKTSDASSTYATNAQVSTTVASALTPYATLSGVSSSFVNANSAQTIVGAKTFNGGASFGTSISMAGFTSTANSNVQGALSINGNTTLGSTGDSQVTFYGDQVNIQSNTLNFANNSLLINKTTGVVSSSGGFNGIFFGTYNGNGSNLSSVTASYVATSSAIPTFTNDVRNQFSAGTNVSITNGVISANGLVTPTQVTSALAPYATSTGVSGAFTTPAQITSSLTNYATLSGVSGTYASLSGVSGTFAPKSNPTFTGAVTASYFVGDGSNLTNLPSGVSAAQVSASFATLTGVSSSFATPSAVSGTFAPKNNPTFTGTTVTATSSSVSIADISGSNNYSYLGRMLFSTPYDVSNTYIVSNGNYNNYSGGGGGANNTVIGSKMINNSGNGITALGASAIFVTNGSGDTAIGAFAMTSCSLGSYNTAVGLSSSFKLLNSNNNVSVGYNSLYSAVTSNGNTAIGDSSLKSHIKPTSGNNGYNVAVGYLAGQNMVSGSSNIFIGTSAGTSITNMHQGVIIGSNNGSTVDNTTGSIIISDGGGNIRIKSDSTGLVTIPGALTVTGTVSMSSVLTLSAQATLPAGAVGMMAVSGTHLYFHNGTAWTMVV